MIGGLLKLAGVVGAGFAAYRGGTRLLNDAERLNVQLQEMLNQQVADQEA
jgi:hypothetical protein